MESALQRCFLSCWAKVREAMVQLWELRRSVLRQCRGSVHSGSRCCPSAVRPAQRGVALWRTACICGVRRRARPGGRGVSWRRWGCGGALPVARAVSVAGSFLRRVDKEDVMTCLIKGCNFVLKNIPHEAFVYQKDSDPEFRFQTNHPNIFPYLLVNVGSGVSIVKVGRGLAG